MSTESREVTKITQVIQRDDGSEVRIVAEAFFGEGLHRSIGVYVHRRESVNHDWILCGDRPHPDWKSMSLADYVEHGRSPMLQAVSHGELLKAMNAIGAPMAQYEIKDAKVPETSTGKGAGDVATKPPTDVEIFEAANAVLAAHLAGAPLPGWLHDGFGDDSAQLHFTLFTYSKNIGPGETGTLRLCLTDEGKKLAIVAEVTGPDGEWRCNTIAIFDSKKLDQAARRMCYSIRMIDTLSKEANVDGIYEDKQTPQG